MPSTINCSIPCSQASWKHGAHQRPRKACGPKSRRSCLSHLLGRKYTKNLAQTRCSSACQISMTALNFHSMQSGQNVRKSRENPSYLRQRLSLATSHIPGAWEVFSMLNESDWGWHRAGKWYLQQRLREQLRASSHPPQPLTAAYPLTMPSKGDLCSCPLSPCWADVLFMQQMLLHTWYLAQEVRFISKKKNKQAVYFGAYWQRFFKSPFFI